MQHCLKFIEEETLLQTNARKMVQHTGHIIVNRTPKCHPELVGKGIEYSWGCSNNYYRRLSLGLYVFYTCMVIYHCIQTDEPQTNSCGH